MLQIGIGHKRNNRIEGKTFLHISNLIRIQKQNRLQPQDQIPGSDKTGVDQQQMQRVLLPAHWRTINPQRFENHVVNAVEQGIRPRFLSGADVINIIADRKQDQQKQN